MFGLSVGKLIVLIVVVLGVWYGYRWLGRVHKLNRERERARLDTSKRAEDMVRCAFCDSYVTAEGARHCGRANCPYPR